MSVGLQQILQGFRAVIQCSIIVLQAKIFDILVGVVQHRVEMAAKIRQFVINRRQFLLQLALYLTGGICGCFSGIGFDQIDNGFCLGQIQLAIEKCPFGELAPLCRQRTGAIQRLQSGAENGRGAVAMKFHRVFAGIAMRSAAENGAAGVDDPAVFIVELTHNQFAVRGGGQRLVIIQCKYLFCNLDAILTGQANDADGGDAVAGRNGSNGVGHRMFSFYCGKLLFMQTLDRNCRGASRCARGRFVNRPYESVIA